MSFWGGTVKQKRQSPERDTTATIVASVVLGLLAIGAFLTQIVFFGESATKGETVLLNLLQFILTAAFSWYGARAASSSEFQRSIKRFAIGAYRRISDIDAIVDRLRGQVHQMLSREDQCEHYNELSVVSAIVTDTKQIINASIADWEDVIGEELSKVETIKDLQERVLTAEISAESAFEGEKDLKQLKAEIKELKASLPAGIQSSPVKTTVEKIMSETCGKSGLRISTNPKVA